MAYAYFPPSDQVVLFGGSPGQNGGSWSNSTLIYANGQWFVGPPAPAGLTARGGAAMGYDPGIHKLVLFGGAGPTWPPDNDTWLYDGTSWSPGPAAPAGLTGRTGSRMSYDPLIHRLVLFGGSGAAPYNDTWLFDGTSWTQGPATPGAVKPRAYFAMAYDPTIAKVFLGGGDGANDTWYFDGTSWTPGPSIAPLGIKERITMDYDPQIGGMVSFGGLGPGASDQYLWYLRGGTWKKVPGAGVTKPWPGRRFDAMMLWHPNENALMMFGGIVDGSGGGTQTPWRDCWFFQETPPQVSAVTLTPTSPNQSQWLQMAAGTVSGGFGLIVRRYAWYVNGSIVAGATNASLSPGFYAHGDQVVGSVQLTDGLNISGPWVNSAPVSIVDRPPYFSGVSLSPVAAYVTSTLTATPNGAGDPDGDPVTFHYVWTVDGIALPGNDAPTLAPPAFTAADTVTVTATPMDSSGMAGAPATSQVATVGWNILATSAATPGHTVGIRGGGWRANEQIDVKLDEPTAPAVATITADSSGMMPFTQVLIPSPLPGGTHMLHGVGRSSGIDGRGPLVVNPSLAIVPQQVSAGTTTQAYGEGFRSGEAVTLTFPGGSPVVAAATGTGSVVVTMIAPPEPITGGSVTASAASGGASARFTVKPSMTVPSTAEPQQTIPMSLRGYGASESVVLSLDGTASAQQLTTDPQGSLDATLVLSVPFGTHTVAAMGSVSGVFISTKVSLPAFLTLSPEGGPPGTSVNVDSGPGWIPGESLTVWWDGSRQVAAVVADGTGVIHTSFVVPDHALGAVTVTLHESVLGVLWPSAPFTVTS